MQKAATMSTQFLTDKEAIDAVKNIPYDVIIMDILDAVKNGTDAVKGNSRLLAAKPPIMMLT